MVNLVQTTPTTFVKNSWNPFPRPPAPSRDAFSICACPRVQALKPSLAFPPLSMRPSRSAFTRRERRIVEQLRTPVQVQGWLNAMPYNWERHGETARTFRGVVARGQAHCLEAALSAATILEQHGYP